jgi:DnaJ-class molecular chaperone
MNNILSIILIGSIFTFGSYGYKGSTTASVVLTGSIIKTKHVDIVQKYKRKDCPVCKGKGWYISGDGIEKVNCGYCEPDKTQPSQKIVTHPPAIMKQQGCPNDVCPMPSNKVIK